MTTKTPFITPAPAIGEPATMRVGSDSYAMLIVETSPSGKTVTAVRVRNGIANIADEGRVFTLRKNGRYILRNTPATHGAITLSIGKAIDKLDPSY